jgi:hypothetical protein
MYTVQFNQLHPRVVKFLSSFIAVNFPGSKFANSGQGDCDIQFNGVRMSHRSLMIEKIKNQVGMGRRDITPELKYQDGEIAPNRKAKVNIWYTGENIRPPLHLDYDFFLSFDRDDFGGRNIYFPLWYLDIDWGFGEKFCPRLGISAKGEELSKPRQLVSEEKKFACAFLGHLHPIRYEAIRRIGEIGKIDVYGKSVGKPIERKFDIAKEYKYTICFENDIYPGYVTEKLLDAYYCETIPIYWGSLGVQDVINDDSHLNLNDFDSLSDFRDKILSIERKDYQHIYEQPFLNSMPNLDKLKEALRLSR